MTDARKFDAEARKKIVEKMYQTCQKAREGIFHAISSVVPPETVDHLCASKKEFLLALRALIDEELKRTDEDIEKHKSREKA